MKKFLMLSMLICGAVSGAWGAENCNLITGDDATNVRSGNEAFSVNGGVYVCDKDIGDDECTYGSAIVYGDQVVYCKDQDGLTDTWVSFKGSVGNCVAQDFTNKSLKYHNGYLMGSGFKKEGGAYVCKKEYCSGGYAGEYRLCKITNDQAKGCFAAKANGEPAEWKTDSGGYCTCNDNNNVEYVWNKGSLKCEPVSVDSKEKQCNDGKIYGEEWDVDCKTLGITGGVKCGKRCNLDGSETGYVTECQREYDLDKLIEKNNPTWEGKYKRCVEKKKEEVTNPGKKSCVESRKTADGKACCYLPENVAKWDGKKCNCVIEGMEFKIENGRGVCVAKQTQPGETFKCTNEHLASLVGWLVSCKDKPEIVKMINKVKDLCNSPDVTAETFNIWWTALLLLNPGDCGTQPYLPPPPQVDDGADRLRVSIRIIRDAHSNLSGMAEGFKVSVWKDDEGKFNTSRLVSDSVAGVVLGTAGGLITSNVVKKNQVENGFEDLKCTIGGQVVADWGDQFRVGIQ